ncbi:MAG: class I SAM-dependent methyltransferase [Candidatus Lokiarchaeota archaeon]|nr:class I SAM-dependent methyltransferase [Candidatus Lokiarchaeota archaeon]
MQILKLINTLIENIQRKSYFFHKIYIIFYRQFIKTVTTLLAAKKLKKLCKNCKSLDDNVNIALSYTYSLFEGSPYKVVLNSLQNKVELQEFIKLVAKNRSRIIIEIGTHFGGTLFLFSRFGSHDALLISIDLPTWNLKGGYGRLRSFFYRSFRSKHQKMIFVAQDSHHPSTLKEVKNHLKNKEIDLLFIDGDHSYEGVKKDFETYSPLVKNDGMIAFHDIVVHDQGENCEVNKFWNEIKEKFEYKEIVENWYQKHWGIGVIINKKGYK